jgi:ketosteroid isomerase-like protein
VDGSSGSDEAAAPSAQREHLAAASAALADAIVSNDPDRIASCLGDEWMLVDADGPTTRAQFLQVVRSGALTHSMMRAQGPLDIRLYGEVAIVFARVVNTARFDGRIFGADEWTTDVFARRGGRWLCILSHVTAVRGD